jgi:hypothetical protein
MVAQSFLFFVGQKQSRFLHNNDSLWIRGAAAAAFASRAAALFLQYSEHSVNIFLLWLTRRDSRLLLSVLTAFE